MKKFWMQNFEWFLACGQSIEDFCLREGLHVRVMSRRFEAHSGNSSSEVQDCRLVFGKYPFPTE